MHKHQNIPELFREIINHDRRKPNLRRSLIDINAVRRWRKRKQELTNAADRYMTGSVPRGPARA